MCTCALKQGGSIDTTAQSTEQQRLAQHSLCRLAHAALQYVLNEGPDVAQHQATSERRALQMQASLNFESKAQVRQRTDT